MRFVGQNWAMEIWKHGYCCLLHKSNQMLRVGVKSVTSAKSTRRVRGYIVEIVESETYVDTGGNLSSKVDLVVALVAVGLG